MLWRTIGCRRSRPESGSSAPRPSTGGVVKGPVSGVVEMGSGPARAQVRAGGCVQRSLIGASRS